MDQTKATPLTAKAIRTRAALISAARRLVGRQGISGVSVQSVCAEAGIGRTSFYSYFNDVEALIAEVATAAAKDFQERFEDTHQTRPRGMERLEECLLTVFAFALEERDIVLMMTSPNLPGGDVEKLLRREIWAELIGGVEAGEMDLPADDLLECADFLSISTLALARRIAFGDIRENQIPKFVAFTLAACKPR